MPTKSGVCAIYVNYLTHIYQDVGTCMPDLSGKCLTPQYVLKSHNSQCWHGNQMKPISSSFDMEMSRYRKKMTFF